MIYCISRHPRFSPNSEARDAQIFQAIVLGLVMKGHRLQTLDETLLPPTLPDAQLVISMGRDRRTLAALAQLEATGVKVLNSPAALLRNTRSRLDLLAKESGVGCPMLANSQDVADIEATVGYPLWLKRGDASAQAKGDVRFVENVDQLREGLASFARNGYTDYVASAHVEGDLVKFYGVDGTHFFHHTLPTNDGGFSKFGLEHHNGAPKGYSFSPDALKRVADELAQRAGLTIYGGDAIVRSDGSVAIIDFNDFPSFGSCTQAAAAAVVECVEQYLR